MHLYDYQSPVNNINHALVCGDYATDRGMRRTALTRYLRAI